MKQEKMMNLILNSNSIQHETDKAVLIKVPGEELKFWHPKKMTRTSGKKGYLLSVWFPNDSWEIKAERKSAKTYETLGTWTGTPSELAESFDLTLEA